MQLGCFSQTCETYTVATDKELENNRVKVSAICVLSQSSHRVFINPLIPKYLDLNSPNLC